MPQKRCRGVLPSGFICTNLGYSIQHLFCLTVRKYLWYFCRAVSGHILATGPKRFRHEPASAARRAAKPREPHSGIDKRRVCQKSRLLVGRVFPETQCGSATTFYWSLATLKASCASSLSPC